MEKDGLKSDVLLWTPTHGHTSVGRPAKTYIHQLRVYTDCSLKDLPRAMNDLNWWQESKESVQSACFDDDDHDDHDGDILEYKSISCICQPLIYSH